MARLIFLFLQCANVKCYGPATVFFETIESASKSNPSSSSGMPSPYMTLDEITSFSGLREELRRVSCPETKVTYSFALHLMYRKMVIQRPSGFPVRTTTLESREARLVLLHSAEETLIIRRESFEVQREQVFEWQKLVWWRAIRYQAQWRTGL